MANPLQQAGALGEPTSFAPLHTNRIFTGLWTNRSPLRDAATTDYQETYGMGRQDSIWDGYNSEISATLTLRRRAGTTLYNANVIPPVKRYYSFNTFTLTDEKIRVMADTAATVYDITAPNVTAIFTKSAGAGSTYFLGIGNTLYFTNGVDNKQVTYDPTTGTWGEVTDWGIDGPTTAPIVTLPQGSQAYGNWLPTTVFSRANSSAEVLVMDDNNYIQSCILFGTTGGAVPAWNIANQFTTDGTAKWENKGDGKWIASASRPVDTLVHQLAIDGNGYFYQATNNLPSGTTPANWLPGIGSFTTDGQQKWLNLGRVMFRTTGSNGDQIGNGTVIIETSSIVAPNGNVQTCRQAGKTGTTQPSFSTVTNAYTSDPVGTPVGSVVWQNAGALAPVQYGYAYMDSSKVDVSDMSPASEVIQTNDGQEVYVAGIGSEQAGVDTIVIYRTAHGGSTFFYLDQMPNPSIPGDQWHYDDTKPDAQLNPLIQAQVAGEGTPLPAGATCLGYHLTRTFAAVGNQVWISSGPDAVVAGSSGNAGFDTVLVTQSKVTRFWACSLGMVVFTVRDAYIILGSATDADPLYMVVFIEDLPLRSYDCFTVNKTTPYLMMGNNQLVALDPSAGIIEAGFPIADRLIDEYDPASSYVTFHSQSTLDTALYVATGAGSWYRMAANNAPEQGSAWSTRATLAGFTMGCVQSVEVTPGSYRLLISGTTPGPILQRDRTTNTDNGAKYAAGTVFGSIVLAQPGQLAALSFITLESARLGTRPGLALLLGEIYGDFEELKRTRQDPTNLPPSKSLYSDRYHFAQNQKEAWCRHFQMEITWPAEDAANELYTFTIFGQTWQEMRSQ